MAGVEVRIDSRALADVLRGPNGPVLRELIERAERVKRGAQQRVGKKTRKLEHSIVKRLHAGGLAGFEVEVGSTLDYAGIHHDGSRPHVILPRKGRFLVFDVGGRKVFARRVNHPGTKPNRFLTDAARAEGFNVRSVTTRGAAA